MSKVQEIVEATHLVNYKWKDRS